MSRLTIKAEVEPGSTINDASKQAVELASKLNTYVEFSFNGVTCIAKPGGDAEKLVKNFVDEGTSNKKWKIAFS